MMKNWQKIKKNKTYLQSFLVREQVIEQTRQFFYRQKFHHVETPILVRHPSTEPFLEVFQTRLLDWRRREQTAYLITSPEYAMKKLLAAGMSKIFQITRAFRNQEGVSPYHNAEFTILEWYRAAADYQKIMDDCEQLFLFLGRQLANSQYLSPRRRQALTKNILIYQNKPYDLTPPWQRLSVAEAFWQFAQIDVDTLLAEPKLLAAAAEKGYQIDRNTSWEEAYHQIFANEIEPQLAMFDRPLILYDYPISQAALSRRKKNDPRWAERFEFYLAGIELGNAFSELNDYQEQRQRIANDLQLRQKLDRYQYQADEDFLQAIQEGIGNSAGIAVGMDRLAMLFADAAAIDQVIFFPISEMFAV